MPNLRRTFAALAAGVLALSLTSAPAFAEADAGGVAVAASSYVALGDSYSSGTGTGTYLADGTSCQRSVLAYPSLVASSKGYALNFRACSGATTADVTNLQLSALTATTTYVSISVGGNDAGFADVLTECAKPAWASNCNRAVDQAQSLVGTQMPTRLATLYRAIRTRAPQAEVVVAGYPRIFNGEDCNAFTWFSPTEQTRLNQTADLLNARTATAATAAGFTFSNPTSAFTGHAVCADQEWLNGLSNPIVESYHPNRGGHAAGYTPLIGTAFSGSRVAVTLETTRQAIASAPRQRAKQRTYASRDRTIEPERFAAPDLDSPDIKRAAARAGVDLRSRTSIDAADARYAAQQARDARRHP